MSWKCKRCGRVNALNYRYCSGCGRYDCRGGVRPKYEVWHYFFGHDERDGLVRRGQYITGTDDILEALEAAREYEIENEIGRYLEEGSVRIQGNGCTYTTCNVLKSLMHGPIEAKPEDLPGHPDWVPF